MVSEDDMVMASKELSLESHGPDFKLRSMIVLGLSFPWKLRVETTVGDGANTLFWKDRWLHGQRIEDTAPLLFAAVPIRKANKRMIQQALAHQSSIQDIQGAISVGILIEYFDLWHLLLGIVLQPGCGGVASLAPFTTRSFLS